jgi:hypothetical protein
MTRRPDRPSRFPTCERASTHSKGDTVLIVLIPSASTYAMMDPSLFIPSQKILHVSRRSLVWNGIGKVDPSEARAKWSLHCVRRDLSALFSI